MVYRVIKTVKGRRYIYEQRTWRVGERVHTECRYVGPADGGRRRRRLARKIADFVKANMTSPRAVIDEDQMLKDFNERTAREQKARELLLGELYDKYGLRVAETPRPAVVAPRAPAAVTAASQAEAKESPSDDEGQDTESEAPTGQNS